MVLQPDLDARRVFVVADATDITAKKVYDAGSAAIPNVRKVISITPYDPTCHKVRIVSSTDKGAVPVYAVNISNVVIPLA